MEYGLWNLPTGFWPASSQASIPVESVSRQTYYTTAGLPVLPPAMEMSEGEMAHYSLAGPQCFRPHTDFLPTKNLFVGRPTLSSTVDDKSQLEGLMMISPELTEPRSLESMSNDSVQVPMASPTVTTDHRKIKIRRGSYEHSNDATPSHIDDYTRQQSFQHPMYGMLANHLAACKEESNVSDDEEDMERAQAVVTPSTIVQDFNDNTESNITNRSTGSSRAGYECGDCGLVANTRVALKKHMTHAHPEQHDADDVTTSSSSAVACPLDTCRFRGADAAELEDHMSKHVPDEFNAVANKKTCPMALQRVRYEREEYRCQVCSYSCTIEKAYYKHLKIHSMGVAAAIKISCVICGKDRTSEVDMNKHMKKHRDDRYFCCDICIFKTVQLKKLIQHRRMHTGEKPHLCPHCSYRSARRDNLRSHVRRVHKKDNLFCDTFSPRSVLMSARPSAINQDTSGDSPAPTQE